MKLSAAIVDDNLTDIARLKNFIRIWCEAKNHELGCLKFYESGGDLLRDFVPKKFQVVFMDILMPELNGINTAEAIRRLDTEILIVFMTTSREYAFDAFHVHPFDYVLKPYNKKNVDKVLDEVIKFLEAYEPKITVKIDENDCTLPVRLISSATSQGHNVEIILTDGKILVSSMRFSEIEPIFSEHDDFLLCNRGVFLNMSQISGQEFGAFVMKNGTRFPIKVRDKTKIKAAFSQYLILNMRTET